MKNLIRTFPTLFAFAIVFAMPHPASARQVQSLTLNPVSASAPASVATNITSTVTVVSGSGGSTRFVGTCTLTATVSPPEPTITATLDPTTFTFPNANTTSNSILTVTTTTATPIGIYLIKVVANTNPPNAALITPVTNTFTLNVGIDFVPQKIWSPAGANINWSTAGNWTNSGVPVSSNDVQFIDLGSVSTAGTVNNVVNSNLTIGSLTYGQTNNFHTTLIAPGVTLTVGGNANGLVAGTGTDIGDGQLPIATISGVGGTLAMTNINANVNVGQAHPTANNAVSQSRATLDMAGLDKFTATISRLLVGVDVSLRGASGLLNLARTNSITATQIDVGDNSQSGGTPTIPSQMLLGQTNGIFADSIVVGRGKTDNTGASMFFNSTFPSPTAYFRGANGSASRVGTWFIGDGYGSRTYYAFGTCDFSSGTVNALVDTMFVGRGAQVAFGNGANNPGTGTLTFGPGLMDVNMLEVGYSTTNAPGTGTVNVNGGSLIVNTLLELAHAGGSSGTLNLSNAILTANSGIIAGGGTAAINVNGGTLNVTNGATTIGTISNPLNTFSSTDATMNFAVQSASPNIATANLAAGGIATTINLSSVPSLTTFPAQFPIIQYGLNGGSASGDLTTFALGTLPSGYSAFISNNVVNSSIDIVFTSGSPAQPRITSVSLSGSNLVITGTNGTAGQQYTLMQSTNVALPLVQWSPVSTNTFTGGSFSITNTVNLLAPQNFFILRLP